MLGTNIFLDILVFVVAFLYWYMTGHYIPAILGVVSTLIFIYSDELYFVSLIMGVITILSIIFFIFYNLPSEEIAISQVTITALYMLVIFFKSKSIFNAD